MATINQTMSINDESLFEDAFRRIESEIVALPTERVRKVNFEVPAAVATVLAVIARLSTHRGEIVRELPSFDVVRFDKLGDYTMAMGYADTLLSVALEPTDVQKAVYDEGLEQRDMMHADVNVLIRRKLIDPAAVKDYVGLVGYKNVATDLQIVAQVLKDKWPVIEGRCASSLAEIEHALKLATRLLRVAGQRGQGNATEDQAADRRNRAFTLFIECYEDAQRAIQYLRFQHEDSAEIAPSLYTGRPAAKKPNKPESVAAPVESSIQASPEPVTAGNTAKTGTDDPKNGPFMK